MSNFQNEKMEKIEKKEREDIIIGRNAVIEALKSERAIDQIFIQKGERSGSLSMIMKKAKDLGITVKDADKRKLDMMSFSAAHQGIVATAAVKEYATLESILDVAKEKNEDLFLIICDEISDSQNLGAILRTADCCGAHGVIIPKRRSVGLNYAVGKASAGAVEYVPVARVSNISATIEKLKEMGVWVYCADMDGENYTKVNYSGAVALVIGSEGQGVHKLVKEKSDVIVSLPMKGQMNSLNASAACAVVCYEIMRQRMI